MIDSSPRWLVLAKPPVWLHAAMYDPDFADLLRGPELLHLTVLGLGGFDDLGCDLAALRHALAGLEADPVLLVLDRLAATMNGIAALESRRSGPAQRLRLAVVAALEHSGVRFRKPGRIRPHVTLHYGRRKPSLRMSIKPIAWLIDELLLVESITGEARHVVHGRFPIRPRQGMLFPLTRCSAAPGDPAGGTLISAGR